MVDGEQETVTDVIVDAVLPPPLDPQAAIHNTLATTNNILHLRTVSPPSVDVAGLNALWHELWNVGLSVETSHVPGLVHHQTRRLNRDRSAPSARLLRRGCFLLGLLRLLIVRTKKLLQIRRKLALPSDSEYGASRRDELSHHGSRWRRDFVHDVGMSIDTPQCAFHAGLVDQYRCRVVAQHRHCRQGQYQKQGRKQNSNARFPINANKLDEVHGVRPSHVRN